jgi:chemotaxis protein CheX
MTMPRVIENATTDQPARNASDQGGPITPRTEWPEALRQATLEVFSTMVGATPDASSAVSPVPVASESEDPSVTSYVTGMIGIAGALRAVFSMRCSDQTATMIASQMLGISVEESAAQKFDAIGEICNMIAGHFKHKVGHGFSCTLTVPSVVAGGNYSIHCLEKGERIEFSIRYGGEAVLIKLDIRG